MKKTRPDSPRNKPAHAPVTHVELQAQVATIKREKAVLDLRGLGK